MKNSLMVIGAVVMIVSGVLVILDMNDTNDDNWTGRSQLSGHLGPEGNGTAGNPFRITNVTELWNITDDLDARYILMNDIDASGTRYWNDKYDFGTPSGSYYGWMPIGDTTTPFNGTLDGKGHTISGLYIDRASVGTVSSPTNHLGLFGVTSENAVISNLRISSFNIAGRDYVGALAGINRGIIASCSVQGTLGASDYTGLFAGYNQDGTIEQCQAEGTFSLRYYSGGFVGQNTGTIERSSFKGSGSLYYDAGFFVGYNTGTISYSSSEYFDTGGYMERQGGFVGTNAGNIDNCHSDGTLYGREATGGFVGSNRGTISNSFSDGYLHAYGTDGYVGGFVGYMPSGYTSTISDCYSICNVQAEYTTYYVGGFIGRLNGGTITRCFSAGATYGGQSTNYLGGFAGYKSTSAYITNCFSMSPTTWGLYGGGFIATIASGDSNRIQNCYSAAPGGGLNDGAFAGGSYGSISGCYYDRSAAQSASSAGTSLSRSEARQSSNYAGWDFSSTWRINSGSTRPYFRTIEPIATAENPGEMGMAYEGEIYRVQMNGYAQVYPEYNVITHWTIDTDADWLSIDGNGLITGTPGNDDVGSYYVNVSVRDSIGYWNRYDYTFEVFNTGISIIGMDVEECRTNDDYMNIYYSSEDGSGTINWSLDTDAGFLGINTTSGELSGYPVNGDEGNYTVNVTVLDGNGGTDTRSFTLDVILDTDGDSIPDVDDDDDDNDGVDDPFDHFPTDRFESMDTDMDGIGNNEDMDDDNDTVPDHEDAFPLDMNETVDTDHDGTGDNEDTDDDNDQVGDDLDAFPLDPFETADTDLDGIGNNADVDDDNDTVSDDMDMFPLDPNETEDFDHDGIGDVGDMDDDNDGVMDDLDAFPMDPSETIDTDLDGTGDNHDMDDDGDNWTDSVEILAGSDPRDNSSMPSDQDQDHIADFMDPDNLEFQLIIYENNTEYINNTEIVVDLTLDTDQDGWSDAVEELSGTNASDPSDVPADSDEDGTADFMDPDFLVKEVIVYDNRTIYINNTDDDDDDTTSGELEKETETPTWAYGALIAAIILALIVVVLLLSSRKKEEEAPLEEPAEDQDMQEPPEETTEQEKEE